MADGAGKISAQTPPRQGAVANILRRIFQTRSGLLCTWLLAALTAAAGASYYFYSNGTPLTPQTIAYAIAASTFIWLPALLFLTDPEATLAQGPRLRLPFTTTVLLIGLAGIAVFDANGAHLLSDAAMRTAFFSMLALVFVPRIWNAIGFARLKDQRWRAAQAAAKVTEAADALANRRDDVERKINEYRAAEAVSAFIVTFVVASIIGAAAYVGTFRDDPSLGASLGVGIFVVVIMLFAIVLAVDWLADMPLIQQAGAASRVLAKPGSFFAAIYDSVDAVLVYIGGHVAGADHLKAPSRYLVLGVTLLCLSIIGWHLPPPFGLVPVFIGLVLGLSVSRLWSWVEEDRNLAAITQFSPKAPQRIGFREDFRDETLLGFIFVLALIPIGMMQAHQSKLLGGPLFASVHSPETPIAGDHFLVWLGYFGFELAKALPIVDWADIYHLGPGEDSIAPTRPLGMHAVFAARAVVDLLLIAALLQALGIASRNRQQKYLYAEEHIDRLDELVEKAELNKAIRVTEAAAAGNGTDRFKLSELKSTRLTDFTRYSEARLRELFLRTTREDLRAFISQLFAERGVKPAPAMNIVQEIAATTRNEYDLMRTFEEARREHEAKIYEITLADLAATLFDLRDASGMRDFKFKLIDFAAKLRPASDCVGKLTTVAVGAGKDGYLYTRKKAAQTMLPLIGEVNDRSALQDVLDEYERAGPNVFGAYPDDWHLVVSALRGRLASLS